MGRFTINTTARGQRALEDAMAIGEENQTDTVNRALLLYANHLRNEQAGGYTEMALPDGTHVRWMIL